MEIHRHPTLTRMWAPVGQQPEIPAPGKNEKQVVYGGVNYKTGKLTYTLAATKCGAAFLVFLMALIKAYAGKKIILVCDNGRFHTTQAVQAWLEAHRDQKNHGVLAAALQPQLELDRTLVGPLETHHLGQRVVRQFG
jgi:hypothetical protein